MFNLSALKGWFGSNPAAGGPIGPLESGVLTPGGGFGGGIGATVKSPFGMGKAADAFRQQTFAPSGMQRFGQGIQNFMSDPNAQMGMSMLANNGQQDPQQMMQQLMLQRLMQQKGVFS